MPKVISLTLTILSTNILVKTLFYWIEDARASYDRFAEKSEHIKAAKPNLTWVARYSPRPSISKHSTGYCKAFGYYGGLESIALGSDGRID